MPTSPPTSKCVFPQHIAFLYWQVLASWPPQDVSRKVDKPQPPHYSPCCPPWLVQWLQLHLAWQMCAHQLTPPLQLSQGIGRGWVREVDVVPTQFISLQLT